MLAKITLTWPALTTRNVICFYDARDILAISRKITMRWYIWRNIEKQHEAGSSVQHPRLMSKMPHHDVTLTIVLIVNNVYMCVDQLCLRCD